MRFVSLHTNTFLLACLFVLSVYINTLLDLFNLNPYISIALNSLLAPLSMLAFLKAPKNHALFFGFLIGALLFYWSALSFRYSEFPYLLPLIIILVALVYGVLFYFLLYFENPYFRLLSFLSISFIHPFNFDWLVPDSFFAYSVFKNDKLSLGLVFLACIFFSTLKPKTYKILGILCLAIALDFNLFKTSDLKNTDNIQLVSTTTPQNLKFDSNYLSDIENNMLKEIKLAISHKKNLIVFPETAYPTTLENSAFKAELENLSDNIAILIGTLRTQGYNLYNSAFLFSKKSVQITDKVILAPFGETMPLPEFLKKPLEKLFFGESAYLYRSSQNFSDFKLDNLIFRPLICYEGTSRLAYLNSPSKVFIVMSNNAWFSPSIEPSLQRMLLKHYARRYHKVILHSANFSSSYILSPSLLGDILFRKTL
ncbi:apolipoprotein N-acyltransferase [Helicobacter cetorum]|uniref:Apolipoprotein N-acyltransferase n=1 Tax=Helicobacter cetorum (strain ATCC BAA-540 / CCUG 52418 / MIT 99-5656) TaxID=1163745 RepID=I0ERQ3_HELCM|nr:apolipoprotein N-acyltransferase [Helicobacter cetorum]AFI05622.1 apolipoprotein N-acyltransferase [Helicobacter cetorum MIT 99-5656]